MKKIFILAFSCLIVISLGFSAATKRSFKNYCNDEAMQKTAVLSGISQVIPGKTENDDSDETEIGSFSCSVKNLLKADLIAEVEPTGKTKWEHQAALCTLKIKKLYKGNVNPGELIDFYETAFFDYDRENNLRFFNITLFTPMKEGKTYIVFANKKDIHPLYEQTLERKVFVSNQLDVSWFQADFTNPPVLSKDREYIYSEIENFEFLCCGKKQHDSIIAFKKDALIALKGMQTIY